MIYTAGTYTAVIVTPDFQKEQAVFFKTFEADSGKVDVEVTTPILIDTTMRDLEIDLTVALEDCFQGTKIRINEITTVNKIRP